MLSQTVEIIARCLAVAGVAAAIVFLAYGWQRGQNFKKDLEQKQKFRHRRAAH